MARLVVKIKYMKPSADRKMGRYAKYIGTREGVVKIDDSHKKQLPLGGVLSEAESSGMFPEEHSPKTYADYIATRPRAERIGKHGLFTDAGVEVNLEDVSRELNAFEGTMWTAIISLRREDAARLGFDTGARWRTMLRDHRDELAEIFRSTPSRFKWYSAFHDEGHHPHVHMIIFDKENRGYLSKEGVEKIKSIFANDIFQDEMLMLEREKSDRRDKLRQRGKDEIEEVIARIHAGTYDNILLQALLMDLARRLREHKGKKYYTYLKKADKKLVDSIIDEIGRIPAVEELYDLWYEKQEQLTSIYKTEMPKRVPLSANPVFKPLRNYVLQAAGKIEVENLEGEQVSSEDAGEYKVIEIGGSRSGSDDSCCDRKCDSRCEEMEKRKEAGNVALVATRLINNVSRIFQDQFKDNPQHRAKVDRKLWQKIREKEEAHGIKPS